MYAGADDATLPPFLSCFSWAKKINFVAKWNHRAGYSSAMGRRNHLNFCSRNLPLRKIPPPSPASARAYCLRPNRLARARVRFRAAVSAEDVSVDVQHRKVSYHHFARRTNHNFFPLGDCYLTGATLLGNLVALLSNFYRMTH